MLLRLGRKRAGREVGNGMETDRKREGGAGRDRREAARRLPALVAELGNVSEACRRLGVDRSAWYRIRKATGAESPPRRNAADPVLAAAVLGLCLQFPEWGCDRLAHYLALKGSAVSSPTVQKILVRAGLGRVRQREEAAALRRASPEGNV